MVSAFQVHQFSESLFNNCLSTNPEEIFTLQVAEFRIRVQIFAEKGHFNVLPLAHILTEKFPAPDQVHEVYVIDRKAYEHMLPEKCWLSQDILSDTSIAGFSDCNFYTSLEADSGNLYLVDHDKKRAVRIFNLETTIAYDWEFSYPLRKIFNQFTRDTPYCLVHAGGLGLMNKEVGIMLTGRGESGKSTVCAVSTYEHIAYAGDDFLLVNTQSQQAWCLYTSLKARPHLLDVLRDSAVFVEGANWEGDDKSNFFIPSGNFKHLAKQFKIKALVKPQYECTIEAATFSSIKPGEMMRYMALSTIIIVRGSLDSDRQTFSKISRLIKNIPCYLLTYNKDFTNTAVAVEKFICDREILS